MAFSNVNTKNGVFRNLGAGKYPSPKLVPQFVAIAKLQRPKLTFLVKITQRTKIPVLHFCLKFTFDPRSVEVQET